MDLLSLLDKCVVLGDALESELVHQVDLVRLIQVLPHEGLDSQGERCAEKNQDISLVFRMARLNVWKLIFKFYLPVEENLPALGEEADNLV